MHGTQVAGPRWLEEPAPARPTETVAWGRLQNGGLRGEGSEACGGLACPACTLSVTPPLLVGSLGAQGGGRH